MRRGLYQCELRLAADSLEEYESNYRSHGFFARRRAKQLLVDFFVPISAGTRIFFPVHVEDVYCRVIALFATRILPEPRWQRPA